MVTGIFGCWGRGGGGKQKKYFQRKRFFVIGQTIGFKQK